MDERIACVGGDITRMEVDAIVNAANTSLLGGGGVDGAIHRAAGPQLLTECSMLGGCETGSARVTRGYNLPARYVIHAVGPRWRGGSHGEDDLLASAYRTSLKLAEQHDCRTVAFPAISTGIYGFPLARAFGIAVREVQQFLMHHDLPEHVTFVCFSESALHICESAVREQHV